MVKIVTNWFANVRCPKTGNNERISEEDIKACSECPHAIWESPQYGIDFMNSMCGVRVGSIETAAEIDTLAENILDLDRFTKKEGSATFKLGMLMQIKSYAENIGWCIQGVSLEETLRLLDHLMEFCKRAEAKGLGIRPSATNMEVI